MIGMAEGPGRGGGERVRPTIRPRGRAHRRPGPERRASEAALEAEWRLARTCVFVCVRARARVGGHAVGGASLHLEGVGRDALRGKDLAGPVEHAAQGLRWERGERKRRERE